MDWEHAGGSIDKIQVFRIRQPRINFLAHLTLFTKYHLDPQALSFSHYLYIAAWTLNKHTLD